MHTLTLWLWVDIGNGDSLVLGMLGGRVPPDQVVATLQTPVVGVFLLVIGAPLYAFYLADVVHRRTTDGWRRYLWVPYLLVPCAMFAGGALVTSGLVQLFSAVLTLLVLLARAVGTKEKLQDAAYSWGWPWPSSGHGQIPGPRPGRRQRTGRARRAGELPTRPQRASRMFRKPLP